MKAVSTLLCLSVLLNCCQSASAGNLVMERTPYGSPTAIRAEGPAPNIACLHDHNLSLVIDENKVDVEILDPTNNTRHTILSGVLFNPHLISDDGMTRFNAYCYFNSGEKLTELLGQDANVAELVAGKDGRRLIGKITSVDNKQISVLVGATEQNIATKQIAAIVSARVFKLTSLVFAAPSPTGTQDRSHFHAKLARFELEPTLDEMLTIVGKKRLESRIAKASLGKWQKYMFIGGAILLTAAAIAIPVALAAPLAGRNRAQQSNDNNNRNENRNQQQQEDQREAQDQDSPIR